MTKRPVRDMSHSLHDRLLGRARQTERPFQELLTYFAMERFIYRLSVSPYADRFVLKGALMFLAWRAPKGRPTRVADFLGYGNSSVEALVNVVREVCEQAVEPYGLTFDPASVVGGRIREGEEYEGVRIRFNVRLDQARVVMQLDIGFGDVVVAGPEPIELPATLPGFPSPRLRAYTRESVIAEKLEAMVSLGSINTRYKDFYDVSFLAEHFDFDGQTLARAVAATFRRRGTLLTAEPVAWTDDFANDSVRQRQWAAFIRRSAIAEVPERFASVVSDVRTLLKPIVEACLSGNTLSGSWQAPGPWRATSE
jgi:Nucleotidyl transferase AbiEii toxin, Type IV TA system